MDLKVLVICRLVRQVLLASLQHVLHLQWAGSSPHALTTKDNFLGGTSTEQAQAAHTSAHTRLPVNIGQFHAASRIASILFSCSKRMCVQWTSPDQHGSFVMLLKAIVSLLIW